MDASSIRERRLVAGMTQRELAGLAGVPQPNIAAYEGGSRKPSAHTLRRLEAALDPPVAERLRALRAELLEAARRRHLEDVRVFGSVARGEADRQSDVDLLVRPGEEASVFDLAGFQAEAEALLGVAVDVVSDRGTGPAMARISAEAVPL